MAEDNIVITSNQKHTITILIMVFSVGVAWANSKADVAAVEKSVSDNDTKMTKIEAKIEVLTSDLNKQAVTIGGIVITTKNIEKQLERQQRLLEQISGQLPHPND